MKIFIKPKT